MRPRRLDRLIRRWWSRLTALGLPQGVGVVASTLLIVATLAYGAVRGGHLPEIMAQLRDVRDAAANTAGFRITTVALNGRKELSEHDMLTSAGITDRSSLLFLDVDAARERLKANPWIADATVRKLYPDRLEITVVERKAFALWQKDGNVSVVATDGTVIEPFADARFVKLPLVVGAGAAAQAHDFITVVDRYPAIRSQMHAAVLVAERRWNLKLKNGLDIKLPEKDVAHALATLVRLDKEKRLLSRDILAVDLRLPDRVSVRLSDDAATARENEIKQRNKKAKGRGGDA